MYKYHFGHVPFRGLGISLGIELVPKKVCSLNCVYCQVGKTTKLTIDRPVTIARLIPLLKRELQDIIDYWKLPNAEIIASVLERASINSYSEDIEAPIMETIARRPCTLEALHSFLGIHVNKIKTVQLERGFFYQS